MQNNLDVFVDKLVEEKGFNEKDPDVIAQIKSDLVSRMEDRINAMIIRELGETKLDQFQELLETGKTEEVQSYVKANITDMDEKIAKELLTFRTIYLG